jgi:hypothetical protein
MVQVCIKSSVLNDVDRPVKGLVEFAKVELKLGEERTIEM